MIIKDIQSSYKKYGGKMNEIIRTEQLTKKYGNKFATNNVNLHVKKGEIYGLIGKNGAGKTTTMKMILGMSRPTSGSIQLFGSDDLDAGRRKIGSLIEEPGLYKEKTAYENLRLFGMLSGADESEIKELLDFVGLGDTGKKKAGEFSLGMRQRLGIAIAMLGNPELLVLDEPINGLDPAGIKEIRDLLLKMKHERGTTILISSHLLDELAKVTTCYGIINNGVLIEEFTAEELAEKTRSFISVKAGDLQKAANALDGVVDKSQIVVLEDTIMINDTSIDTSVIAEKIVNSGNKLYELTCKQRDFEQYFIERIG